MSHLYRHFKGGLYRTVFEDAVSTDPGFVGTLVVYVSLQDGTVYVRPAAEFFGERDGVKRFVRVEG